MTEELSAVAVPSTDVPVAVDPALLNKPVRPEEQPGNSDAELLKHKLGLANQHAKQAKKEADDARQQMQQLKDELEQMKALQQSVAQKSLEDQGAFKDLWEQAKRTVSERDAQIVDLKAQLASVTENVAQERLKAAATQQLSQANAVNPTQLYQLLAPQLRVDEDGKPVLLSGGVEVSLADALAQYKQSPDWQHHFGPSAGGRGMGASPTSTVAPGMSNPYRSGNLTEALLLEAQNPELAKALKAEAQRG
jgi:hypothetical protein